MIIKARTLIWLTAITVFAAAPGQAQPQPAVPGTAITPGQSQANAYGQRGSRPHLTEAELAAEHLWRRYTDAGEQAHLKHDDKTAKQYWFADLAQLEKVQAQQPRTAFLSIKVQELEQGLASLYPQDWTEAQNSDAELKLRQEQLNVLQHIAELNTKYCRKDSVTTRRSVEAYEKAAEELKKAKESKEQKPTEASAH